jgi:hypothetical protein
VIWRMDVMGDNSLLRTDCEVHMHCNNSTLSQVPEMYERADVRAATVGFFVGKVRDAGEDAGQVTVGGERHSVR